MHQREDRGVSEQGLEPNVCYAPLAYRYCYAATAVSHASFLMDGMLGSRSCDGRTRAVGDEVMTDEVRADGWVRICNLHDTREAYELYNHERAHQRKWMLVRSDDAGEMMREVVLDGDGEVAEEAVGSPGACVECT